METERLKTERLDTEPLSPVCAMCLETTEERATCVCKGTVGYVHGACVDRWRREFHPDDSRHWLCAQCGEPFAAELGAIVVEPPAEPAGPPTADGYQPIRSVPFPRPLRAPRAIYLVCGFMIGWLLTVTGDILMESRQQDGWCWPVDGCHTSSMALIALALVMVAMVVGLECVVPRLAFQTCCLMAMLVGALIRDNQIFGVAVWLTVFLMMAVLL